MHSAEHRRAFLSSRRNNMNKIKNLFVAGLLTGGLMACASFDRNVYNAENLAVDGVAGGVHAFNLYYAAATNGAAPATVAQLNKARDQVYTEVTNFHHVVSVVDGLRLSYAANPATSNRTALAAALGTLSDNSGAIVSLVGFFMHPPSLSSPPATAPPAQAVK